MQPRPKLLDVCHASTCSQRLPIQAVSRPKLMAALLPTLARLEPYTRVVGVHLLCERRLFTAEAVNRYTRIVGVHLRTGYADWSYRKTTTRTLGLFTA